MLAVTLRMHGWFALAKTFDCSAHALVGLTDCIEWKGLNVPYLQLQPLLMVEGRREDGLLTT
jgi:hypothetical protein